MSLWGGLICNGPHCPGTESSMKLLWSLLSPAVTEIMEADYMLSGLSGHISQGGRTAPAHFRTMRSNPVKILNTYCIRELITPFYNCLFNCLFPGIDSYLQEGKSCISLSYYCVSTNWCNAWHIVGTQHTVDEWIKRLVYATLNVVSKLRVLEDNIKVVFGDGNLHNALW